MQFRRSCNGGADLNAVMACNVYGRRRNAADVYGIFFFFFGDRDDARKAKGSSMTCEVRVPYYTNLLCDVTGSHVRVYLRVWDRRESERERENKKKKKSRGRGLLNLTRWCLITLAAVTWHSSTSCDYVPRVSCRLRAGFFV